MKGLIDDAGHYRQGGIGVMKGDQVVHMAPPANRVSKLMRDLLHWLEKTDQSPLIASCAFHYELEFIHSFADGNGRMGRLWQTLILSRWQPLFAHVPLESLVHGHQAEYYAAINESTEQAESVPFIVFMLSMLRDAILSVTPKSPPKSRSCSGMWLVKSVVRRCKLRWAWLTENLSSSAICVRRWVQG